MTVESLITRLQETFDRLELADATDNRSARDLHILLLQLQQELAVAAFDPLKDLDKVSVADTSKLASLCDDVQASINDEKKRVDLVEKIVATAKIALRAGGVPIPA
ncbi:MAG: hypothetical protein JWO13_419 [Acidobacteriales bacterium]|nr:hypothetical protein [Terriglobales bacterium]